MNTAFPFLPAILEQFSQTTSEQRFLVGIVGAPASGKSYLAERLPYIVNQEMGKEIASSLAMDGYHLYNKELYARGMYPHKGSHFTFDVQSFIEKLIELKESSQEVSCPIYDRRLHDPTAAGHRILTSHRMVFVEGNYLLSSVFPWSAIKYLLDVSVFVEVDPTVQFQRLVDRHMRSGNSRAEAEAKAHRTDLPNSDLIRQDKDRADFVHVPEANRG